MTESISDTALDLKEGAANAASFVIPFTVGLTDN